MKLKNLVQELVVKNVEISKWFYVDVVGFSVNVEDEENRTVHLRLSELQIALVEAVQATLNGRDNAVYYAETDRDDQRNLESKGVQLEFLVEDIESVFAKMKSKSVRFYKESIVNYFKDKTSEYITKEFIVLDPDNNLLKFSETMCL